MYIDIEIKKKKKESLLPEDEYSKYIFNKINELRKNRQHFIKEIKENKSNKTKDKHKRLIFKSKKFKFSLVDGIEAFNEVIEDLKNVNPIEELIYFPEINISFPQSEEEMKD